MLIIFSENGETELEGVWKFPQVPDNISLNSYDEDTDATDVDSTLGTPLPESELSFFDPLSQEKTETGSALHTSKSWLMDAINTCAGSIYFYLILKMNFLASFVLIKPALV